MKLLVIGGNIRGVEAVYLACQAGWEVIVADSNPLAPAAGLCNRYVQLDIFSGYGNLACLLQDVDFIFPAYEDSLILEQIQEMSLQSGVPTAVDFLTSSITSDREKIRLLLRQEGIPISDCLCLQAHQKVFCLSVAGYLGSFTCLPLTELEITPSGHSGMRAPVQILPEHEKELRIIAEHIAKMVNLIGILEIKFVYRQGRFEVLTVDAGLPKQSSTLIFKSTGINVLKIFYDIFCLGRLAVPPDIYIKKNVMLEFVFVSPDGIKLIDENSFFLSGPFRYVKDFFGAGEAVTNYYPGQSFWTALLIIDGFSFADVREKYREVIDNIRVCSNRLSSMVEVLANKKERILVD